MDLKNKMAARILLLTRELLTKFATEKIAMRVKTQAILKVKKTKMMRVENKVAVKTKIKKTTGLLVLSNQQD